MSYDAAYKSKLKNAIITSLVKHKINRQDKKAILKALPQIWKDLEAEKGLLKEGMNYEDFESQALHAYELSNFEEMFSSFFGGKR